MPFSGYKRVHAMPAARQDRFAGLRRSIRILKTRNYRLFFIGQGISLIGTWMQSVASGWLVYRLSGSELMLGVVAFSGQVPAFFISPIAGVLADRLDRRKIMVVTQILSLFQAACLAALAFSGAARVWHIAVLSFFLGLINGFDMPTRHAFIVSMVEDKSDFPNVIALNSVLFNGSRLVGPAIAGVAVAAAGEGVCFLFNAISYCAALAALLLIRVPAEKTSHAGQNLVRELREGAAYVFGSPPIRFLLMTVALMSLVSMSFPVLMPVFAASILGGKSDTYGMLVGASGLGALAGTVFLAMRRSVLGLSRIISVSMLLFGSALIAFSFSRTVALSLAILVVIGFGMILSIASCNTVLQTIADEDKRGRVMSFYVMAFMGAAPLGSILAGAVSSGIGATWTVFACGVSGVLGGIIFNLRLPYLRGHIRPIYRRIGIIPEMAAGIQTADELRKPPEFSGN